MRIRKRHPLFSSLHSLPTLPSDPHLNRPSPPTVVQLTQDSAALSSDRRLPSDQPLAPINGWDHTSSGIVQGGAHKQPIKPDPPSEEEEEDGVLVGPQEISDEEEESSQENKDNHHHHSRKGSIIGSQTLSQPSTQDGSRWCEEEKSIPFKKRMRGSFENGTGKKVVVKARMKTKMNKKCATSNNNDDDDQDIEDYTSQDKKKEARGSASASASTKPNSKKRGSAVMEGSRCSRVNGRGWRCCQQTLVGYSLCEHHLGKGRLRSMTSVRNRSASLLVTSATPSSPTTTTNKVQQVVVQPHHHNHPLLSLSPSSSSSSPVADNDHNNNNNNNNKKQQQQHPPAAIIQKKRMNKLGMVKARSLSSLLGQTTSSNAAT